MRPKYNGRPVYYNNDLMFGWTDLQRYYHPPKKIEDLAEKLMLSAEKQLTTADRIADSGNGEAATRMIRLMRYTDILITNVMRDVKSKRN